MFGSSSLRLRELPQKDALLPISDNLVQVIESRELPHGVAEILHCCTTGYEKIS